jgi:hypothetical protein
MDITAAVCCRELDCQQLGEVVQLVGGAFPAWTVEGLQQLARS